MGNLSSKEQMIADKAIQELRESFLTPEELKEWTYLSGKKDRGRFAVSFPYEIARYKKLKSKMDIAFQDHYIKNRKK